VATTVQNSSHSPQGAFGYLLSQLNPRPRLTVATHFPTTDDNVYCALESVRNALVANNASPITWSRDYDAVNKNMLWSYDGMVLRLFTDQPNRVEQRRIVMPAVSYDATPQYTYYDLLPPKYPTATSQLDLSTQIEPTGAPDGKYHFNSNGY
jgi:ribonuclease Z